MSAMIKDTQGIQNTSKFSASPSRWTFAMVFYVHRYINLWINEWLVNSSTYWSRFLPRDYSLGAIISSALELQPVVLVCKLNVPRD